MTVEDDIGRGTTEYVKELQRLVSLVQRADLVMFVIGKEKLGIDAGLQECIVRGLKMLAIEASKE